MGSSLSPIIANLYMEEFETKALNTAPTTLLTGKSVEKISLMTHLLSSKSVIRKNFSNHINSIWRFSYSLLQKSHKQMELYPS